MSRKPPSMVIRTQAMAVIKTALEAAGFKILSEQYDGTSKTDSVVVRSRGVETIVLVADPSYLNEPEPDALGFPRRKRP